MTSPLDFCQILVRGTWIPLRDWLFIPSRSGEIASTEDELRFAGWGC